MLKDIKDIVSVTVDNSVLAAQVLAMGMFAWSMSGVVLLAVADLISSSVLRRNR